MIFYRINKMKTFHKVTVFLLYYNIIIIKGSRDCEFVLNRDFNPLATVKIVLSVDFRAVLSLRRWPSSTQKDRVILLRTL